MRRSFDDLAKDLLARPGATERLAARRAETLADIDRYQQGRQAMTEPDRTLAADDNPTMDDMRRWHTVDRPTCPSAVFQLGPAGYRCLVCHWWVECP